MKHVKLVAIGYHSISHPSNTAELHGDFYKKLSLSAVLFEEHIRYLKDANYTFLQFHDILSVRNGAMQIPKKPALIYFDDGFRDTLLNAYPLLKKWNIPATIFVTTDFVGQKSLPRWAEGHTPKPAPIFLSWDDVRSMRDVFEIGSHAVTHRRFIKLSYDEMKEELIASRARIEKEIGEPPVAFSFPHSAWNEESKRTVLEAGYRIAVGVGRGYNYGSRSGFFKKIPIGSQDDSFLLRKKLRYLPILEGWRRIIGLCKTT